MWVLFSKSFQILLVNCGLMSSNLLIFKIFILSLELLKPALYCLIASGLFNPCSVDIGSEIESLEIELFDYLNVYNQMTDALINCY